MTIYTAAITLFLVMDPLGNIPFFLNVLNSVEASRRKAIILRECCIALVVLMLFLFFGKYILEGMQISEPALSIGGGIILFLISIKMIFPNGSSNQPTAQVGEPFIVPLAIPLVAGPSCMALVMLLANQHPEKLLEWAGALMLAWVISTTILLFGDGFRKILGVKGLIAIERLMGMILTTMAVQMFLQGIQHFFHLNL